jgi:hypothetical protein
MRGQRTPLRACAGFLPVFLALSCLPAGLVFGQRISVDLRTIERERVLKAADVYLGYDPRTVTASASPRSPGGPHDYFSEGDYWWPDPKNPDGPHIRRDGMTNPSNFDDHRQAMRRLSLVVPALTAAYKLTGERKYAEVAARHLRAWFVAESTRMAPHLNYSQAVKGVATGRAPGVIDTIHLIEVARSVPVIEASGALSGADAATVRRWFAEYLQWLTTSPLGMQEREAKNNHGTCWVMQAAAFAQLVGDTAQMSWCRKRFRKVLLPDQMAADGSFPLELARTKPYGYSLFNLDAMATLCQVLSTPSDDLWAFTLPDGRGMKKGMEFLFPFIRQKSTWPHPPDVMFFEYWPVRQPALLFAGIALNQPEYVECWKGLEADPTNDEVIRNLPVRQPLLWY